MSTWKQLNAKSESTYLCVLKSSSLSLNPLLRSILIPSRANSASLMGSVFASSRLPGAVSAGAAIETPYTAGEGGTGVGGVRSVKLLYSNAQASRPVTQFFAANAAMFTTFCQPTDERSLLGFGRCSVRCRPPAGVYVPATGWTHTGNAEHFEASEFSTLRLYVANISDITVFLICGGY